MADKTILFPTDFSYCGDAALEMATSLARDQDAKLLIVHVEELPGNYEAGAMYYGFVDPPVEEIENMLRRVTPNDPSVPVEHRLEGGGDPASGIIRVAEKEHVEMIVMGTHGRSGLKRMLMGSIAEEVVRRAKCPVITFRQPENALADST